MNVLQYTDQELEKQMGLLEIHLKQTSYDKDFCQECIRKHVLAIEGLAEEGIGFSEHPEKYAEIAQLTREIRNLDISDGVETAQKVRKMRKSLSGCSECKKDIGEKGAEAIEKITKDLNNPSTIIDYKLNKHKDKKMQYAELAYMNAGQFAAEGIRYLADTYPTATPGKWKKYIQLGGGAGLQVLGLFVRLPEVVKNLTLVAGSNLLANGVVELVKGTAPVVRASASMVSAGNMSNGLGGYAGKSFSYAPSFGGPTFAGKVTATNIPTRYARAGILSGAQAFEAPEHADLIRVD